MGRLVSERVWPGYSRVNMDKGILGRSEGFRKMDICYAC